MGIVEFLKKRNYMRPYLLIVCILAFFFFTPMPSLAKQELVDLHIYVKVLENGDALIRETRVAHLTEGTENFIPITNLGGSKIINFTVEEDGILYEYVDLWNSQASREEKTFKNGLIKTSEGYELVWGIGKYGNHEYVLQYTVTDMIKQLEDAQILFWKFVNDRMNIPPQKLTIEIEADFDLSYGPEKVWGFGFEGEVQFEAGKVHARSLAPFKGENYATILLEFEDGRFSAKDTRDWIPKTIEEIKDEAFKGSDYKAGSSFWEAVFDIFITLLILVFIILLPGLIIIIISKLTKKIIFKARRGLLLRKIKRNYKNAYFSDLPYEYDFIDIVYLLYKRKLTSFEYIISAYFLQWIHEGLITQETEVKKILREKEYIALRFHKNNRKRKVLEKRLYHIFYSLSGWDRKISPISIIRWSDKQRQQMKRWQEDLLNHSRKFLTSRGYIERDLTKLILTEEGEQLEAKVYQFIKYLYDFSLINEHEVVDVKLWDQLLVWAAVLGLTDVVLKQFENIHPDYISASTYTSTDTISFVNQFSREAEGRAKEKASSSSDGGRGGDGGRASGGGGYTSVGGGGGSFGGGSGGGTR